MTFLVEFETFETWMTIKLNENRELLSKYQKETGENVGSPAEVANEIVCCDLCCDLFKDLTGQEIEMCDILSEKTRPPEEIPDTVIKLPNDFKDDFFEALKFPDD